MKRIFTREYTGAFTFPVKFGTNDPSGAPILGFATWLQVVGAGNVVVVDEDDGSSQTHACIGGEVITGKFRQITSMTCARVRAGNGDVPPAVLDKEPATQSIHKARLASGANKNVATGGLQALDGVTPSAGDRVLLFNQTAGAQNGIWLAAAGAWARASDFDEAISGEVENGIQVHVAEGVGNGNSTWELMNTGAIVVGTTALVFCGERDGTRHVVDGVIRANVADLTAFAGVTGGTRVDGTLFSAGARLLLVAQTTGAENGIYVVGTVAVGVAPLFRASDWAAGNIVPDGEIIYVGGYNTAKADTPQDTGNISNWLLVGPVVVGTDAPFFQDPGTTTYWQFLPYVRCVVTGNVANLAQFTVADAAGTNDGVTLREYELVLLVGQTTASQNGPWVCGTIAAGKCALTRPTWFAGGNFMYSGFEIRVGREGTKYKNSKWIAYNGNPSFTVDTDDPKFYPEALTGTVALVGGTIDVLLPVFSVSSFFKPELDIIGGTLTATIGYAALSATGGQGLTAGTVAGGGKATICAYKNDGTKDTANTSTVRWMLRNQA